MVSPVSEWDKIKDDIDKLKIGELRKKIIHLSLAYKINQEIGPVNELEKLVKLLMERIISILRVEMGSLMLVDKMQKQLSIKAAKGLKEEIIKETKIKFGEGISGWVAKEAKPLLIKDLSKDGRFKKRGGKYSTDSLLTVPLVVAGELIGVLNVNNKTTKDVFDKDDMDMLLTIANHAALLIKNSQKYGKLEKLSRVKSDFVSVVSHELRTPLATIKESLAILLEKIPGQINKKQEKVLTLAKRNIDRLNRLVTNLLDLSKLEAGKMQMQRKFVNVTLLMKEVVSTFEPKARQKSLSLNVRFADDIKGIWADSDKIAQVFNNLLSNAVKYTQKGGKIDIILKKKNNKRNIEIIVKDTGRGIKKENINRVFDKFSRISFKDGNIISTGLGLAITKEIVESHRGNISAESKLGKGSKFVVSLPMDLRGPRKRR